MTTIDVNDANDVKMPTLSELITPFIVLPKDPENDDQLQMAFDATWDNLESHRKDIARVLNVDTVLIDDDTIDMGDWMWVIREPDSRLNDGVLAFVNVDIFDELHG